MAQLQVKEEVLVQTQDESQKEVPKMQKVKEWLVEAFDVRSIIFWAGVFVTLVIGISWMFYTRSTNQVEWISFWGEVVGGFLGLVGAGLGAYYALRGAYRAADKHILYDSTKAEIRDIENFLKAYSVVYDIRDRYSFIVACVRAIVIHDDSSDDPRVHEMMIEISKSKDSEHEWLLHFCEGLDELNEEIAQIKEDFIPNAAYKNFVRLKRKFRGISGTIHCFTHDDDNFEDTFKDLEEYNNDLMKSFYAIEEYARSQEAQLVKLSQQIATS